MREKFANVDHNNVLIISFIILIIYHLLLESVSLVSGTLVYGLSLVWFFRSLFFGDYMNPESPDKIYDEVMDLSLLTQLMEG